MWASDYPHGDGTFPNSLKVIEEMFGGADPELRRKVLGGTASKLYRL